MTTTTTHPDAGSITGSCYGTPSDAMAYYFDITGPMDATARRACAAAVKSGSVADGYLTRRGPDADDGTAGRLVWRTVGVR